MDITHYLNSKRKYHKKSYYIILNENIIYIHIYIYILKLNIVLYSILVY